MTDHWLTYEDFAGRVGDRFEITAPAGSGVTLTLAAATLGDHAGGLGPDNEPRQQFSLLFRGPAAPALGQGTYSLEHDGLNGLALFLVPLGPDADGQRYEAAFA